MTDLNSFIQALPKAELHLHIEGSLEPALAFQLAKKHGVNLPYKDEAGLAAAYQFSNLQEFLDIYYLGAGVLRDKDDFEAMTMAYFARLNADNGAHAEIFFDPQTHLERGISMDIVMGGITSAMAKAHQQWGISSGLIMCFLRHLDEKSAFETLEAAMPFRDQIIGVGLDSSELGHPPSKFARVFEAARAEGLKLCAHAGEEGPAAYIWEAIDILGVDRIDHGNRCLDDDALISRLVADKMTLTVCPLSNTALKVVDNLANHPLKEMLDLGLKVTINADDPAYFGGYLGENYRQAAAALGLSRGEILTLAQNSFSGSFLREGAKAQWQKALSALA